MGVGHDCTVKSFIFLPFHKNFNKMETRSPQIIKGLQRQHLIGWAVAGFNPARTITKISAAGLDGRQYDYNKGICSPGSLFNIPLR